ncbi:hypothetical protein [uncultured Desulfuromonas sp.]|uniref:hypothetical protein n=1 Tax=uncultured Desulfuromonas sp. TaxID=181013 RepID=UPI002AABCA42|nr:hypothetical protein [uncultured Desulfuromonas sp.]
MQPIHITKTGKHTASNGGQVDFTEERLTASAEVYDPALHRAPIVIGHPKTDAPAYGWIKSLNFADGNMFAEPEQVEVQFEEMVKDGRFGTVSASWYPPDHPGNPSRGSYYLKHVGFLGAAAPAIKGLKQVEFASEDKNCITVDFAAPTSWNLSSIARMLRGLREMIIEQFGRDEADKTISAYDIEDIERTAARPETPQPQESSFTEKPQQTTHTEETATMTPEEIAAKEAELKKREDKLKQKEADQAKTSAADFCESLVKQGRLLPAKQNAAVSLLTSMSNDTTVDFSEGDATVTKSQVDTMKDLLSSMGKQIDFSEVADTSHGEPQKPTGEEVSFSEDLTSKV